MKRLIDAHDFWIRLPINAENITLADVTEALGGTPTVDAEIVRHGYWIDTNEGTYCSECFNYPYDDGEYHILHWRSDYCPHCGAKMNGEIDG